jgi:hypothetical protein
MAVTFVLCFLVDCISKRVVSVLETSGSHLATLVANPNKHNSWLVPDSNVSLGSEEIFFASPKRNSSLLIEEKIKPSAAGALFK